MDISNITLDDLELIENETIELNDVDVPMLRGLSAYAIAVKNGFSGSESDWLNSLKVEFQASANAFLEDAESSENVRKSNELTRISSENTRGSQESTRQLNEGLRTSNEDVREANEAIRTSNETTRISNESTRVTNEATRQSNETARVTEFNQMKQKILYPENVNGSSNIEIERTTNSVTIKAKGLGTGDMQKATYDTNDNGIVDNAEKVNNHTVEKDVPSNAVFTDTVYDDTQVRGLITSVQNSLANYYLKTETYSQTEINQMISVIPKFAIEVVQSLPSQDISSTTIYLVVTGSETQNLYTEYIYVNNSWEKLGTQTLDLSNYYNKTEVDTLLSAKASQSDLQTLDSSVLKFTLLEEWND